ncbi:MAG: hypothetical protein IJ864_00335 [Alphaproteobacteria bacterium]|nr:hypothetical protein [Alphaproteobacteria bacterium]
MNPKPEKSLQHTIELTARVDEIIRLTWWSTDHARSIVKEIFRIKSAYYLYTYETNQIRRERQLREISQEEFLSERKLIFKQQPYPGMQNWKAEDKNYEVKQYYRYKWKKILPAENCIFRNNKSQKKHPSELKQMYLTQFEKARQGKPANIGISEKTREKINDTMQVSVEMGISFENARVFAANREKIMDFMQSYNNAMHALDHLSPEDIYKLYADFRLPNRKIGRKRVLKKLGISYFGVDVSHLNLSELDSKLTHLVEEYQEASIHRLISRCLSYDYSKREDILNEMTCQNQETLIFFLRKLGVNTRAVDVRTYPLATLREALAASIGVDPKIYA